MLVVVDRVFSPPPRPTNKSSKEQCVQLATLKINILLDSLREK